MGNDQGRRRSAPLGETGDNQTLAEVAYRTIRSELLTGGLDAESKLGIDELRTRIGIGASPIREALSRLVSEGFVKAEERRGFRAASISVQELSEITELRILLECEGLKASIAHGGEDWESDVLAKYHLLEHAEKNLGVSVDRDTWNMRNQDFHDATVGACGSLWLMRLRSTLYDHSQRYRYRIHDAGATRVKLKKDHKHLRDAVLKRDVALSCTLIDRHFRATLDDFKRAVGAGEG